MSSSDLAISVRGLSKSYTIRHQHESHITLAEQALSRVRHPLRRPERETFWALDDVSFDVRKGEVLGIIGRNGAGKSTLLKVLSRITAPTKGEVRLYGRIGSLLEVGTGFHPELTGRENVYLNGSILGMKAKEIDKQFDAIVDFAGVEKFLDTPVKRYSSGMYVRLAFAVAAHLETEILLLDEVLAVGDAEFQKRCFGKIGEVQLSGRTVLLVTHQASALENLATRALQLNGGRVAHHGLTKVVLEAYLSGARSNSALLSGLPRKGLSTQCVRVNSVSVMQRGRELIVNMTLEESGKIPQVNVVTVFHDQLGRPVASSVSQTLGLSGQTVDHSEPARFEIVVIIPIAQLVTGHYRLTFAVVSISEGSRHVDHDFVIEAVDVELVSAHAATTQWPGSWGTVALPESSLQSRQLTSHLGGHGR